MNQTELMKCVNQKGMLALVATWATAFFLGSQAEVICATIAACFAYLSDWAFVWNHAKYSFLSMLLSFSLVAVSIILSILRAV